MDMNYVFKKNKSKSKQNKQIIELVKFGCDLICNKIWSCPRYIHRRQQDTTKRSADSRTHTHRIHQNKENKIEHKSTKTIYERQLNVQCVCNIVVDLTSSNSFPNLTQI